ncbi:MAG: LysE family transporter [Aquincola sp.]|nr:LysE family transporter [Aquincola sp.]|tara:strand:+ start:4331 stop:4951 length:621 start_codon:yes stop_codon:yes gene_type:complete
MVDTSSCVQGYLLALGMFVCPGPKDILILRQALHRRPAAELIAIGVLSDALLITLGVCGLSAMLAGMPSLQTAALALGVALMVVHGLVAGARALAWSGEAQAMDVGEALPRWRSLASLLTVSLVNPAAWLDTVLVIGTAGAVQAPANQASFSAGAVLASATWFIALVLGGRYAGSFASSSATWRAVDALVAVTMLGLALFLATTLA